MQLTVEEPEDKVREEIRNSADIEKETNGGFKTRFTAEDEQI